jgi:hypothetical protein
VAPLAPSLYTRQQAVTRAWAPLPHEPTALRRRAVPVSPPPALSPSPYELALAPSPYGAIPRLAPDPYVDQRDVGRARPGTSFPQQPPESAVEASPRLALAPSPYQLAPPMDIAPNPY